LPAEKAKQHDRHKNKLIVGVRGATPEIRDAARAAAAATGLSGGLSEATVLYWRWLAGEEVTLPVPPNHVNGSTS
jgi:hypothetical protein